MGPRSHAHPWGNTFAGWHRHWDRDLSPKRDTDGVQSRAPHAPSRLSNCTAANSKHVPARAPQAGQWRGHAFSTPHVETPVTDGPLLSLPGHGEACLKAGDPLTTPGASCVGLETGGTSDGVLEDP